MKRHPGVALIVIAWLGASWFARAQSVPPPTVRDEDPSAKESSPPIPYAKGDHWGYADATKRLVVPAVYDLVERFTQGRGLVTKGKLSGFVDAQGNEIVPLRYTYARPFTDGLAAVGQGDQYGFIDRNGVPVLPLKYSWVIPFEKGVAKVTQGPTNQAHWGLVDTSGHFIVPPTKYAFVGDFSEDLAPVYEENTIDIERFGFVDRQGREVIPVSKIYSGGGLRWSEGRFLVRHKGKFGYIDKTGREVVPAVYDTVLTLDTHLVEATLNDKVSYFDLDGKPVPPPKDRRFFDADGLSEAAVGSKRFWADRKGKQVIPPLYDLSRDQVCVDWILSDGLRGVTLNEKHGFINSAGVAVIPVQYECTGIPSEGLVAIRQNGLWGFADYSGKVMIPFKYFRIDTPFEHGYAQVTRKLGESSWLHGYIDRHGTEFFEEAHR